jgi:methionyl-tRNA formyltransferase
LAPRKQPAPPPPHAARAPYLGLVTHEAARLDWTRDAADVDRLVRGCDPSPGALALRESGEPVRLFDARFAAGAVAAEPGTVLGLDAGRLAIAARGGRVTVGKLRVGDGAKVAANAAGVEAGERLR